VEWLAFGRTQWSLGARGVFSDLAGVRKLSLTFINVRLRDGRNKKKSADVVPYLTVSLTRKKFGKLDIRGLRKDLEEGRCVEAARRHLSSYQFDNKYYTRFQDDRL
jgi:hypothetical protein